MAVDARSAWTTTRFTGIRLAAMRDLAKRRWKSKQQTQSELHQAGREHRLPGQWRGLAWRTMELIQAFRGRAGNFLDRGADEPEQVTAALRYLARHVKDPGQHLWRHHGFNIIASGIVAAVKETGLHCRWWCGWKAQCGGGPADPGRSGVAIIPWHHGGRGGEGVNRWQMIKWSMKDRMGTFYTNARVENHVDRKQSAQVNRMLWTPGRNSPGSRPKR